MKKFSTWAFLAAIFVAVSCNSGTTPQTSAVADTLKTASQAVLLQADVYSGNYKMTGEEACDISIVISKKDTSYSYVVKSFGKEYAGIISIEKQDADTYLIFGGEVEGNKPNTISALYADSTLTIQNSGNAMNPYNFFQKCDAKYLEFKK